jgi:2-desacetyl-2-hydroxyethyl bacteriochlorophyllide A dehydrogenase
MKAILFPQPGKIELSDLPDPTPAPDEVVIEMKASGICATDIHIWLGEFIASYPVIPGHEFAGEVVELGGEVKNFKVGDRVAVDPCIYCHNCHACKSHAENFCRNFKAYGLQLNGGFAEYVAVKENNLYRIDGLSWEEGAMVEPMGCVVHGLNQVAPIKPGGHGLIFGAGPIGLLNMQLYMGSGLATVTVVDIMEHKLKIASELGATHTVLGDEGLSERLREIRPEGFDLVIDATGKSEVVQSTFDYVAERGKILFFGVCPPDARISISPYDVYKRELKIYGSFSLLYTAGQAVDLLRSGKIRVEPLISHRFPIEGFVEAFELKRDNPEPMKVMITG